MHQEGIRPRPEKRKNRQEKLEYERGQRIKSQLLGLIHGYLFDLQTVVRTDRGDGQAVK